MVGWCDPFPFCNILYCKPLGRVITSCFMAFTFRNAVDSSFEANATDITKHINRRIKCCFSILFQYLNCLIEVNNNVSCVEIPSLSFFFNRLISVHDMDKQKMIPWMCGLRTEIKEFYEGQNERKICN